MNNIIILRLWFGINESNLFRLIYYMGELSKQRELYDIKTANKKTKESDYPFDRVSV